MFISNKMHTMIFVLTTDSIVPMIDYNRKSFIYLQPIIDRLEFWESIIIRKIPKQKNFIFI